MLASSSQLTQRALDRMQLHLISALMQAQFLSLNSREGVVGRSTLEGSCAGHSCP